MTAVAFSILTLIGALLISGMAWLALGRPERLCPGCDQPESRCDCGDVSE